jgi:hypothetical protein
VFKFPEIVKALNREEEMVNFQRSQNLQKAISDYLAAFLVAIGPKKALIEIDSELDIDVQIKILSQLKGLYGHANFWVLLPEVDALSQIPDYKRMLTANGFRRSGNFKILQKITQPLFFSSLGKIREQGIDGMLIESDSLLENCLGFDFSKVKDEKRLENLNLFKDYIVEELKKTSTNDNYLIFKSSSLTFTDKILSDLLDLNVNAIHYPGTELLSFKEKLAEKENDHLTQSLKQVKKKAASL